MRGRLAYTIIETARALETTPAAVRKAIERGQISAVTFGMAIRVPADEIERVRANIPHRQRLGIVGQRHAEDPRAEPRA